VTTAPTGRIPSVFDVAFLTDAEPVTELILVRHGQQDVADGRDSPIGDLIDPPLSALGRKQAQHVGRRFADTPIDAVYSSNLRRAFDTGLEIARRHGMEPIVDDDLREVELFRDIPPDQSAVAFIGRSLMLGIRERMISEKVWDVYPHSESSAEFRKRTVNAIEGIVATNEGRRLLIACHAGVINAYVGHHLGIARDMFFRPAHTAVNVVLAGHHGVRAVQSLGDVHHLLQGEELLVTY
jgi:broad specificity phosphatase PhoE